MRRDPIKAQEVRSGDLIIARNSVRLRVEYVRDVGDGLLIIHGRGAAGPTGISHREDDDVIRLE